MISNIVEPKENWGTRWKFVRSASKKIAVHFDMKRIGDEKKKKSGFN